MGRVRRRAPALPATRRRPSRTGGGMRWKDAAGPCGLDLLQDPLPTADKLRNHGQRTIDRLERWRWMGFVFWDRDRVEAGKRTVGYSSYQTGWLVRLRAPGG